MKTVIIYINLFLSAKSDKAKDKVTRRTGAIIDNFFESKSFLKTKTEKGFKIEFNTDNSWPQIVYIHLQLCQALGYSWYVNGIIEQSLNAWTNNSGIVGVESIGIDVINPDIERNYNYATEDKENNEDD